MDRAHLYEPHRLELAPDGSFDACTGWEIGWTALVVQPESAALRQHAAAWLRELAMLEALRGSHDAADALRRRALDMDGDDREDDAIAITLAVLETTERSAVAPDEGAAIDALRAAAEEAGAALDSEGVLVHARAEHHSWSRRRRGAAWEIHVLLRAASEARLVDSEPPATILFDRAAHLDRALEREPCAARDRLLAISAR